MHVGALVHARRARMQTRMDAWMGQCWLRDSDISGLDLGMYFVLSESSIQHGTEAAEGSETVHDVELKPGAVACVHARACVRACIRACLHACACAGGAQILVTEENKDEFLQARIDCSIECSVECSIDCSIECSVETNVLCSSPYITCWTSECAAQWNM